jgi:hypothetical protein
MMVQFNTFLQEREKLFRSETLYLAPPPPSHSNNPLLQNDWEKWSLHPKGKQKKYTIWIKYIFLICMLYCYVIV